MRQNSKDVSDQAIVTVEKTSRKIVLTTAASTQSQVTMSLVTSSPSIAKSAVQVHNLSTQQSSPAPSTQLSLVPAGTNTGIPVNSAPIVSATAAPLSIQLARPQPQHPNGPTTHQTLTVVPGSLRLDQNQPSLVVVRQSGDLGSNPAQQQQKHQVQQHHQSKPQLSEQQDLSITNANSVKELWINRIAPPMNSSQLDSRTISGSGSSVPTPRLINHHVTTNSLIESDTKIQAADQSKIKELLLKRGGATTLEPASTLERRDSSSSSGSNQSSNQLSKL